MQYKETPYEQICGGIITSMSVRKVCQGYEAKELAWSGNPQKTNDEANMRNISGLGGSGNIPSRAHTHCFSIAWQACEYSVAHSVEFPSVALSDFQFTGSLFSHSNICKCLCKLFL